MHLVRIEGLAVDEDVIHIGDCVWKASDHGFYESLKNRWSILQLKGHSKVLHHSDVGVGCRLGDIAFADRHVEERAFQVQRREDIAVDRLLDPIDPWQWVGLHKRNFCSGPGSL